jgi:hypothetical protein
VPGDAGRLAGWRPRVPGQHGQQPFEAGS